MHNFQIYIQKSVPGNVRGMFSMIGFVYGGLPIGESALVCPAWAKTCHLKGDDRK
jgi:hypothetical protein